MAKTNGGLSSNTRAPKPLRRMTGGGLMPWRRGVRAAFLLLLSLILITEGAAYPRPTCSPSQFWDDMYEECSECRPCNPESLRKMGLSGKIRYECKDKNPDPINSACPQYYNHCVEAVIDDDCGISSTPAITAPTTNKPYPTSQGTTPRNTTSIPSVGSVTKLEGTSWNTDLVYVVVSLMILGVAVLCIICFIRSRRNHTPSPSVGGTTDSQRSSILKQEEELLIINQEHIEQKEDEKLLGAATSTRVAEENMLPVEGTDHPSFTIEQEPKNPVTEGDEVKLRCVLHGADVPSVYVRWNHRRTGRKFFGTNISISLIMKIDGGEYDVLVKTHGSHVSESTVWIIKVNQREGSPRDAIEYPLDVRKPEESSLMSHPSQEDHRGYILPAGADSPFELITSMWEEDPFTADSNADCTLLLRGVLEWPDELVQLAVILDHNNTILRGFSVGSGRLTQQQIKYIVYCTQGKGNTVKGFLSYITSNQPDLTVYDFLKFLVDKRFPDMEPVLRILHQIHDTCPACTELVSRNCVHSEPGPDQPDIRYVSSGPDFSYHDVRQFRQCRETLNMLLNQCLESEDFREEIKVHLDPQSEIWRGIGRALGGFSPQLLNYLEFHYRDLESSVSLRMLEHMVTIYPGLKVAALIEWLHVHRYSDKAAIVLDFHDKMPVRCDYCRNRWPRSQVT